MQLRLGHLLVYMIPQSHVLCCGEADNWARHLFNVHCLIIHTPHYAFTDLYLQVDLAFSIISSYLCTSSQRILSRL